MAHVPGRHYACNYVGCPQGKEGESKYKVTAEKRLKADKVKAKEKSVKAAKKANATNGTVWDRLARQQANALKAHVEEQKQKKKEKKNQLLKNNSIITV
jgi:hypothetical protein